MDRDTLQGTMALTTIVHRHPHHCQQTTSNAGEILPLHTTAKNDLFQRRAKCREYRHGRNENCIASDPSSYKIPVVGRWQMIILFFFVAGAHRFYDKNFRLDEDFVVAHRSVHSLRPKRINNDFANDSLSVVSMEGKGRPEGHVIPNIAVFTYKFDLLSADETMLSEDELLLKRNVERTMSLHHDIHARFLDDKACLESIRSIMLKHPDKLKNLDAYFIHEPRGMYKADICRGAALYETGGLYFDIDLKPRMSMWSVIDPGTQFVVPQVYEASRDRGMFFQAFIGTVKEHPMILRYMEKFCSFYSGEIQLKKSHFSFFKPFLGVALLRYAYDEMSQRTKESIVLWKEVKYSSKLFPDVDPPLGIRRSCHYVIGIPGTQIVPFYSRIPESRLCKRDVTGKELYESFLEYLRFTFIP